MYSWGVHLTWFDCNASSSSRPSGWLRGLCIRGKEILLWHTPLIVALTNEHNGAFTFLIDIGADVNLQDHQGYTALHYAAEQKNFDAVTCLDLFTFSKRTPLMLACESHIQNMDAINFLLNKGADVNLQDYRGYTGLHYAVKSKNFDASSCLVYNGADVNLQDRNGQSALHIASSDICHCLIQNQADIDIRDSRYCTSLMQASCDNDVKKVAMLIENGAKVDLQDVDGNTALHHAVNYYLDESTTEVLSCTFDC